MNREDSSSLFQRAGEIIVNKYKYEKADVIPEKYMFFYMNYVPFPVGQKRKYEDYV